MGSATTDFSRSLIELSQQGSIKNDVPDAVVPFLQANVVAGKRMAQKAVISSPAKATVRGDQADLHVSRIVRGWRLFDIRSRRRRPARAGSPMAQGFMRTLLVIPPPEGIEPALLAPPRRRGGARRLTFEFAVHPFMGAVLLRRAAPEALVDNPLLHPPHIEGRPAMQPERRERRSIVRPDRLREPDRAKQGQKYRSGVGGADRSQSPTHQHGAAEMIGHRQGIAVLAIAHPELTLEVGGPDLVGMIRRHHRCAGVRPSRPSPIPPQQLVPRQQRHGTYCGWATTCRGAASEAPPTTSSPPSRISSAPRESARRPRRSSDADSAPARGSAPRDRPRRGPQPDPPICSRSVG
jgi:hypothetical protein